MQSNSDVVCSCHISTLLRLPAEAERQERTNQDERKEQEMNTEEARIFFREKNARRKEELNKGIRKQRVEERRHRRSLLNGAFGRKETNDDFVDSTSVD